MGSFESFGAEIRLTTKKDIGLAIKYYREKAGLRQEDLAKKIKQNKSPTKNTISRIERGITNYNIDWLFKIAEVLNCDVSDFLMFGKQPSKSDLIEKAFEDFKTKILEEFRK